MKFLAFHQKLSTKKQSQKKKTKRKKKEIKQQEKTLEYQNIDFKIIIINMFSKINGEFHQTEFTKS